MLSIVILSVIMLNVNNEECKYAESRHAECASILHRMGKIVFKNYLSHKEWLSATHFDFFWCYDI
jgi:hypothetical protein